MSTIPTVYFIDDSATMREVIKIAFRRENINVVTCQDAASALVEIEQTRPAVVITDVIMPGKDGYEVCQHIKNHPALCGTPVVLMSGVVNRSVAERAFAVKADELLRKPFQPQDLITRVKHLLKPSGSVVPSPAATANAAVALSSIFSSAASSGPRPALAMASAAPSPATSLAPRPLSVMPAAAPVAMSASKPASSDPARIRIEILRLEGLVKKLQSELLAEREYSHALEAHIKTLQEAE
jgi:CheY-like chemotaxis protein